MKRILLIAALLAAFPCPALSEAKWAYIIDDEMALFGLEEMSGNMQAKPLSISTQKKIQRERMDLKIVGPRLMTAAIKL